MYNSQTADQQVTSQLGFTGIQILEDFITEAEEDKLLQYLDEGGVLLRCFLYRNRSV